jgi:hypothetical protein
LENFLANTWASHYIHANFDEWTFNLRSMVGSQDGNENFYPLLEERLRLKDNVKTNLQLNSFFNVKMVVATN